MSRLSNRRTCTRSSLTNSVPPTWLCTDAFSRECIRAPNRTLPVTKERFVNPRAGARGKLKVYQRIRSRHAGERTRTTVMAHRGRVRRPSRRLLLVEGRRRPRRADPPDRGGDGGRLPDADRAADPAPGRGPTAFRVC